MWVFRCKFFSIQLVFPYPSNTFLNSVILTEEFGVNEINSHSVNRLNFYVSKHNKVIHLDQVQACNYAIFQVSINSFLNSEILTEELGANGINHGNSSSHL